MELKEGDVILLDKEAAYWKKAVDESDATLERLDSALKYEKAVNRMCKEQLADAETDTAR